MVELMFMKQWVVYIMGEADQNRYPCGTGGISTSGIPAVTNQITQQSDVQVQCRNAQR